jgi:hypothetical protein
VAGLLRRCVGFGEDNAQAWARHIERNGSAKLGPWCEPVATRIHEQLEQLAPRYGCHSLRVSLEKDSTDAARRAVVAQGAHHILREHFAGDDLTQVVIVKREFPTYLRVDVQRGVDAAAVDARRVGVHSRSRWDAGRHGLADLRARTGQIVGACSSTTSTSAKPSPRGCDQLPHVVSRGDIPLATWVNTRPDDMNLRSRGRDRGAGGEAAGAKSARSSRDRARGVRGPSFRGKILSWRRVETYRGQSASALTVHHREPMGRATCASAAVAGARAAHRRFRGASRGVVALGQWPQGCAALRPPGTGKTHTIRYLAQRLADHTTVSRVTAEQIGLIATYFRLAPPVRAG